MAEQGLAGRGTARGQLVRVLPWGWSRHEVSWMGTAKELAFCSVGLLLGEGLRSTVSMPRLNVSVSAVFSWPGFLLTPHALPKHFY